LTCNNIFHIFLYTINYNFNIFLLTLIRFFANITNITRKENTYIIDNIKDMVEKKLNVLINILFSKDKKKWYESLKIQEETKDSFEYYDNLIKLLDYLLTFNTNEIEEEDIEIFCEKLLLTPELNSQITKLLLKRV